MPRDHTSYLLDMLVAAHDALAFADGLSYSEFAIVPRVSIDRLIEQFIQSDKDHPDCIRA